MADRFTNSAILDSLRASTLNESGQGSGAGASIPTPGTLSVSTINNASGNHTHAVTSSSNPGGVAALLASAADGGLQLLRLGLGVDPDTDNRFSVVNNGTIGLTAGPLLTFESGARLKLEGGALRIAYNGSNYADLQTDSGGTLAITPTGSLTLQPAGDITLNPAGNDVLPLTNYDINLGALGKKYLTLHAAELRVETLVAQNTIATIGGRILVGPTTTLSADISTTQGYLSVKHNQLTAGDRVYMEADGKIEFMAIGAEFSGTFPAFQEYIDFDSSYGDITALFPIGSSVTFGISSGPYTVEDIQWTGTNTRLWPELYIYNTSDVVDYIVEYPLSRSGIYIYTVTRNLDGSGGNIWYAGDAVFNTGTTGDGFIDLYSVRGVKSASQAGPTIVGNVRNSATYNDWSEHWGIGNLNGLYGYGVDTYGVGLGKYANGQSFLTVDATNGLRIRTRSGGADTTIAQWAITGAITIGQVASGQDNLYLSSGAIAIRNNTTERIALTSAGVLTIKNSSGNAVFTFDSSAGAEFTLPLTLATGGGIYQGSGTFASPTTGLKIWNDGGTGRIGGYNGSTLQWYAATDGKLYGGAGAVLLDATGISITAPDRGGTINNYNQLRWTNTNMTNGVTGYIVSHEYGGGGGHGRIFLVARSNSLTEGTLELSAYNQHMATNYDIVTIDGYFYLGDSGTDGSWRIARSGNNLVMERRESGAWVTKQTITP